MELPILTNELCKEYLGSKINITDNHLCAGHDEGKRDGCTMDSGGGLTTIKSGVVKSRFSFANESVNHTFSAVAFPFAFKGKICVRVHVRVHFLQR